LIKLGAPPANATSRLAERPHLAPRAAPYGRFLVFSACWGRIGKDSRGSSQGSQHAEDFAKAESGGPKRPQLGNL